MKPNKNAYNEQESEVELDIPEWVVPAIPKVTNKATTEELILRNIECHLANIESGLYRLLRERGL